MGSYRDIVYQPHDSDKNRNGYPAVCYDAVDFIGNGQRALLSSLNNRLGYDILDIGVSGVGDDGFRIVILVRLYF